jgi:WD40 repeat protein/serine/threonine protein kinase
MASLPTRSADQDRDAEREERLHEIIAGYLEAVEAGSAPDRDELLAREPDLAAEIAAFLANQDHLARLAAPLREIGLGVPRRGDDPLPDEQAGLLPGIVPFPFVQETSPDLASGDGGADATSQPTLRQVHYFGDYELLDVIARGGMGVVYRARQVSLNRILALKMVRAGALADPHDLVRFRLEAEAVAHLDHPHIVPIFEVGEHEGHHYYSMKLVDGGNLAIRAASFQSDPRGSARLIAIVARAVHYAHQRGILHRDLKPANILLGGRPDDPPDRLVPLVTDFGLAKRIEAADASGLTSSGSIVGTPSYMAPEQAEGRREAITLAVDVHALGAILYELLVGKPPFRGDSVLETLRQVREREPVRPRSINPRAPRDLETIVLKCLEKNPQRRYHSAEALAEDLERWLADLPIRARPATPLERLVKWTRRRPAAAAVIVLASLAILATTLAIRSVLSGAQLETEIARARSDLVEMEDETYFKQLIAAEQAWEHNDPVQADQLLERCPVRHRGWEWYHLRRRFYPELQTFQGHSGYLCGVSFRPDSTQVICAGEPRGFQLWETAADQVVRRIPGQNEIIYGLAFDRAGTRMASAEVGGLVKVWDLTTGENLGVLHGHRGWVAGVAFSGDGSTLASAGEDGLIRLWNLGGKVRGDLHQPARALQGHTAAVFGVAFSPVGRLLASAGDDATVRVWDLGKGPETPPRVFRGHHQAVHCVAFHPFKHVVASAGADRIVRVWDADTGGEMRRFGGFGNRVDGVAFSPDGSRIATACLDRSVRVWDAGTGAPLVSFPGHAAPAFSVAFNPDGTRLASASQDATVKIWDLTSEPGVRLLRPEGSKEDSMVSPVAWVGGVAFRPDGTELAAAGAGRIVAAWNREMRVPRQASHGGWGDLTAVRYSPDGSLLATAGADGTVRVRDSRSLEERFVLADRQEGLVSVAFSPGGRVLATGGGNPPVVIQQPKEKTPPAEGHRRSVRLWDAKTGAPLGSFSGHLGSIHALAFDPSGTRLMSAGTDRIIRVWDPADGRLLKKLEGPDGHTQTIYALALAPDGKLLASAGADGVIRIWDVGEGRPIRSLPGHRNWVLGLAFHPDGTRLASAGADQTIRLWDPAGGREVLGLRGHRDRVFGVAFSPDGSRLASASADGIVRVWEADRPYAP